MKHRVITRLSCAFALLCALCLCESVGAAESGRATLTLNDGWQFAVVSPENYRAEPIRTFKIGDKPPREQTEAPKDVRAPHDWAIELGFDPKLDGATGKARWRGVGIYSKTLVMDPRFKDCRHVLTFDGAMSFPEVTVNGVYAGGWDYGYLGFQVDVTPFLTEKENLIEVRCDTREHRSRWYPGAGLYRGVELVVCSADAWLPQGSVEIRTDVEVKDALRGSAKVEVNCSPYVSKKIDDAKIRLRIAEKKPDGAVLFEKTIAAALEPTAESSDPDQKKFPEYAGDKTFSVAAELPDVALWDVESPNMYVAQITLLDADGNALDSVSEPFGFRTFEWTVDDGFHLNGRRVQLYGVDLHHDQGLIGAASHPAAVRRQLQIMRDMGVNAIRTSHNPNSSAFMDACDEMGFVVWDELFDKWDGTAGLRKEDDFFTFSARQARQFGRRDRNRPSVCAWSIGNEIASIEANTENPSNPDKKAKERVAHLSSVMREYGGGRPVGQGCFADWVLGDYPPKVDSIAPLDIAGWNYGAKYRKARASYPNMPVVYTESASAFSTRGYYDLKHPVKKDQYDPNVREVDSYDLISANGPRDIPDVDFERMEIDRYVAGEFVWTGFDYIGEPAPYEKDTNISYFGIVDLCGAPKDRFWLYRSHWNKDDVTVHILPHWNWGAESGKNVPVYVYTSGDSAELFLNGKSLGRKAKDPTRTLDKPKDAEFDLADYYWIVDKYRLRWEDVAYEPGTLEVVAYKDGKEIGRETVRTAGEPAKLEIIPEKPAFESDDDLLYFTILAVDSEGVPCPEASNEIEVEIDGAAVLAGLGTGNHASLESFADNVHTLFHGQATLVLRSRRTGEWEKEVKATVNSNGLKEATVKVKTAERSKDRYR